jgi:hypothetical protein
MGVSVRGDHGELRVGYQVAATFRAWAYDAALARVDGTPGPVHEVWITYPMACWLKVGEKWWVWSTVELLDRSTTLSVRLVGSATVRE